MLGLLVLAIGLSTISVYAEIDTPYKQFNNGIPIDQIQCNNSKILMESSSGRPACVNENSVEKLEQRGFLIVETDIISELKPNDMSFETITIQSNPLEIFDNSTQMVGEQYDGLRPPCILPSSMSVQVPDRVQVSQTFDVTITPSFELTQQQLDDYDESYGIEFDNARELWDAVCDVEIWRTYVISYPATYESSGDGVSYRGHHIPDHYFPPYERHISHLDGLSFNSEPTTFQMTVNEPIIYLASDIDDRENLDYLKYDYGDFTVIAATLPIDSTIRPVSIYTSIDDGLVTLSELESSRSQIELKLEDLNPDDQFVPYRDPDEWRRMPHEIPPPAKTNDTSDLDSVPLEWIAEELEKDYNSHYTAETYIEALGLDDTFLEEFLDAYPQYNIKIKSFNPTFNLDLPQAYEQSIPNIAFVYGDVTFLNSDDIIVPVYGVNICALDVGPDDSDSPLMNGQTPSCDISDSNGNFRITVFLTDLQGGSSTPDIRLQAYFENDDFKIIEYELFSNNYVNRGVPPSVHSIKDLTTVKYNISGPLFNYGNFELPHTSNSSRSSYILNSLQPVHDWYENTVRHNPDKVTIDWTPGICQVSGTHPHTNVMRISELMGINRVIPCGNTLISPLENPSTLRHEYAHQVQNQVYMDSDTTITTGDCGSGATRGGHSPVHFSGPKCAWVEGWAFFMATSFDDDPVYQPSYMNGQWNFETRANTETEHHLYANRDFVNGNQEGNIAAALYDVVDSTNEVGDNLNEPISRVWNAFDVSNSFVKTIEDFEINWNAQGGPSLNSIFMLNTLPVMNSVVPDITFTSSLNSDRSRITLFFDSGIDTDFNTSDFTLSQGTISSVRNFGSPLVHYLYVSGVPYDTGVTVTYVGSIFNLGSANLVSGTSSVTNSVSRPTPVDTPPRISSISDMSLDYTQTRTINVRASDSQNDSITLSLVNAPSFASIVDNGNGRGVITLSPSPSDVGSHNLIVKAVANSKKDTERFRVTVTAPTDTINPTITAPEDKTFEATSALTTLSDSQIGTPTATDNIDTLPTITNNKPSSFPLGNTIITWTATDDSGNSSKSIQTITILDTTDPMFTLDVSDMSRMFNSGTDFVVNYDTPSATDLVDADVDVLCDPVSGSIFSFGENIITCTATDDSGNFSTTSFVVSVTVIIPAPSNLQTTSTHNSVTLDWDDSLDESITGYKILSRTSDQMELSTLISNTGSSDSMYVVEDLSPDTAYVFSVVALSEFGESSASNLVHIITMQQLPMITAPSDISIEATGILTDVDIGSAIIPDNSGLSVSNDAPISFSLGTTIVTWTVIDGSGNPVDATQNITVMDTTDPMFTLDVSDMSRMFASNADFIVNYDIPSATDLVDSDVDVLCDPVSGSIFSFGENIITCTATDDSGNFSTTSFVVSVSIGVPAAAPSNLQATSIHNSVTLDWDDTSDESISGYKILFGIPFISQQLHTFISDTGSSDSRYVVNGLSLDTDYIFSVVALNEFGESTASDLVYGATLQLTPIIVNLQATSTYNSVTLDWGEPSDESITGYKILSRTSDQRELSVLIPDTGSSDSMYVVGGLSPNTDYIFSVGALNEFGDLPTFNLVHVATLQLTPIIVNLQATSTHNSVTLDWDDSPDESITGYKILSRTSDQRQLSVLIPDTGSSDSMYVVEDLLPDTIYVFRVVALNEFGESSPSEYVRLSTLPDIVRTTAPPDISIEATGILTDVDIGSAITPDNSGLSVSNDAPTSFSLGTTIVTWTATDDSGNSSRYIQTITILDTTDPVFTLDVSDMSRMFASGADFIVNYDIPSATDLVDSDVDVLCDPVSGSIFSFGENTVTCTAIDDSGNFSTTSFVVYVSVGVPAAPSNLQATSTHNSVTLNWDDSPDESITRYKILSRTSDQGELSVLIPNTGSPNSMYVVEDLLPDTIYVFRVVTLSAFGESPLSIPVRIATLQLPPMITAPPDISLEATGILTDADIGSAIIPNNLEFSVSNDAPTSFSLGTTLVTWTVTDDSGNTAFATQNITIVDTTKPTFDPIPVNMEILFIEGQSRTVSFDLPTAYDRVDNDVDVICNPASGTIFALGTTTVTCTATDDSGNSTVITFDVFVSQSTSVPPSFSVISDTFDSSLDSWTYKETPNTLSISRYCNSALNDAYVLSHSTENGGSAHTSNTVKCWFGSAGATKSFVFPANYNTLEISLDYRGLTTAPSAHVNNIHLMITDSSNTILHTSNIFTGDRGTRLPDTGWHDFEVSIPSIDSSQCPCKAFVYLVDAWVSQWHQNFFMDNIVLSTANTATQLDGLPVNVTPNSLRGNDYLNMQASNSTVIREVNLFSDAIKYSWNGTPDTDYSVVISPVISPQETFADSTSDNDYTFVNLEPSTLYDIAVGPSDDDSKQSHLQFMTLSSDLISFDSQIILEVNDTTDGIELSWIDSNDIGNNRYIIERVIDGIADNVGTIVSEPYLFVEQSDPSWSGKTVSWKVFEYLGDQKLYSNNVSVNVP